jgi:hypothetical protein
MLQLDYILNNWDKFETPFEDRLGHRLCQFLTIEQAKSIGWEIQEPNWIPQKFTKKNIISQLRMDVAFGFKKALNKRGISASMMYEVVRGWLTILEDPLKDFDNYPMYGLPLFKAVATKYGFDNPIGEDDGSEDKYRN